MKKLSLFLFLMTGLCITHYGFAQNDNENQSWGQSDSHQEESTTSEQDKWFTADDDKSDGSSDSSTQEPPVEPSSPPVQPSTAEPEHSHLVQNDKSDTSEFQNPADHQPEPAQGQSQQLDQRQYDHGYHYGAQNNYDHYQDRDYGHFDQQGHQEGYGYDNYVNESYGYANDRSGHQDSYEDGIERSVCQQPSSPPCYCPVCSYKPKIYCERKCEYVPVRRQKKHCRWVPQYYEKTCCRYVPQYYTKQCCRYVPQYYYTSETDYCKRWRTERRCLYEPHYTYKPVYCDKNNCPPNCQ
jgi:hypothetical protein